MERITRAGLLLRGSAYSPLFMIVVSLLFIACGEKHPHEGVPDTTIVRQQTPNSDDVAEVPVKETTWIANTRSSEHSVTDIALLGDLRTSMSPAYERIVFVFRSASLPNWHIEYIDKPIRSCGSGELVPLAGDACLEIRLEPTNAHDTAGHPTAPWREKKFAYRNLLEMKLTCDFEAVTTFVAGLRSPNKYRVLELKDPTRLVVDIQN
jgi:hypothetical protein